MHRTLAYFYIFFIITSSCTTSHEHGEKIEKPLIQKEKTLFTPYEIIDLSRTGDIKFENIEIDTVALSQEVKGVKLKVDITVPPISFEKVKKLNFNSYYFEIGCETDCNLEYSSQKLIKKEKRVHINREEFFSTPTKRTLEFEFPYRSLEMKEGVHELVIKVNALPIKFKSDTSTAEFRIIDRIGNAPLEYLKLKVKVKAPRLYKTVVEVERFEINTQVIDPQKFDFSFGGSGYPDLYWNIYCGEDLIYYAPQQKNSILFNKKSHTKTFFCSKDDILKINIADYDNGPFNTQDDIIETWTGKLDDLIQKKYKVRENGKLKSLEMTAKIVN